MRGMAATTPKGEARRPYGLLLALCCALCCALGLGLPAASAHPLPVTTTALLAQHTGGSFGGSNWGSGSAPSRPSRSGSYGGSYGRSSGSYGGSYGGSSRSSDGDGGGLAFLYLLYLAFSVHPLLGFAVLGVGLLFFWMRSS